MSFPGATFAESTIESVVVGATVVFTSSLAFSSLLLLQPVTEKVTNKIAPRIKSSFVLICLFIVLGFRT